MSTDPGYPAELIEHPSDQFEIIPRALLRDHTISANARSILFDWLSHRASFRISIQAMAARTHLSVMLTRRAFQELRAAGFLHFSQGHKLNGGWGTARYAVANHPVMQCGIPRCVDCGNRAAESASQENNKREPNTWDDACRPDGYASGAYASGVTPIGEPEKGEPEVRRKNTPPGNQPEPKQPDASQPPGDDAAGSEFEKFWEAYPRKVGKTAARRAWAKAVKGGVSPSVIMDAVYDHADQMRKTETRYIPHPTTWLNQGRWDDQEDPGGGPRDYSPW